MQIITVAPVSRGLLQGELTYFSMHEAAIGSVVMVPIRSREIPAIVLSSQSASTEKSSIKASTFTIRKIAKGLPRSIWLPEFIMSVEDVAIYSAQKFGELLLLLTPKLILDQLLEGTLLLPKLPTHTKNFEILALQGDTEMRVNAYQRLVRESFVKGESVFICVPTEEDVTRIEETLSQGIEEYAFALYSSLSKKKILDGWKKIVDESHPVLVVATPQYLSVPRVFKTMILDEEHSRSWKMVARPYVDTRLLVEHYARNLGVRLILGAPLLRAETYARVKDGEIDEFGRISLHTRATIETRIIDPRIEEKAVKEYSGKREMVVIGNELRELIAGARTRGENVLLLVARKGLSPVTSCGDCGTLIRCPTCDSPLALHKRETSFSDSQIFVCHSCGFMRVPENNVNETCPQCGGWRLQGIGIATELIEDEIKKFFPDSERYVVDANHTKTKTEAKKVVARFENSRGAILIATPMVIPILTRTQHIAIVSIDSLFSIPDIRMSERIFTMILSLREKCRDTLLIQTRADDTLLLERALRGDLAEFSNSELEIRKMFSYPPYGVIIKIAVRGKKDQVSEEINNVKNFLSAYAPIVPGTISREQKNVYRMHMILKLEKSAWPSKELLERLRTLPPHMTVEINPDHLL